MAPAPLRMRPLLSHLRPCVSLTHHAYARVPSLLMLLLAALWLPQHATKATSTSNFTEDELIHLRTDSDAARISFGLDRDVYLVRKEEGELELGGQLRLSGGQGPERGDHAVSKSYMDNALAELREEIATISGRCLTALSAPVSCIHA